MSICTINFNTGTLTGAILPNAKLVFRSTDAPLRPVGARVAPADRYEVTADAGGAGSVTLAWGNWTVTMMASDGQKVAPFSVPQAASARLEDLLGAPLTSVYTTLDLVATGIAGARLFATTAAALLATRADDVFLAPLLPSGMGVYRTIQPAANMQPGSAQQVGAFFNGAATATPTDTTAGRLLKVGDSAGSLSLGGALRVPSGGTANAITLTSGAGISGVPPTGLEVRFRAGAGNTGPTTLALDGGTARECRAMTGAVLPAGYVRTDVDTVAEFNGTFWILNREPEFGENANGSYSRFANGWMTCTRSVTTSASAAVTALYAVPFAVTPAVAPGVLVGAARGPTLGARGTTSVDVNAFDNANARQSNVVDLTITGRWF